MNLISWNVETRKHPTDGQGYYDFLEPSEMAPVRHPVPGYLHAFVYADGTLNERPYRTSANTSLVSGVEHDAPVCRYRPPMPPLHAVQHDPDCLACGYRITRTLDDMAGELHHQAETFMLGFDNAPEGRPVASAVLAVQGSGWAATADPGRAIRVDTVTFTGPAWLARSTNGQPVPEGLDAILSARYGLDVEQVPTIHELPGTRRRTPPMLSGEGYHHGGRYGRYGGAGVLLHHEGKYLLGRRSDIAKGGPGTWAPPGGNRTLIDSDPWEDALLELWEETGIRPDKATSHGYVTYTEGEWSFVTYAATTNKQHKPQVNYHALAGVEWVTAEQMRDMNLMPEFRAVLPQLLARFPEDE